ncbi:MAG TPA: DUF4097 family beta strand repeat-containing protein [Bryobacteraceae bacterium]|nr:DUF4097 family beta strand repeat-containing protein [Bryobacteraceae bacterium]
MKPLLYSLVAIAFAAVCATAQEGSFDRSLSVSGPVTLEVKTDSGGIQVRSGSGSTVRVHAYLKAEHSWFGAGDAADRIRRIEKNPPVEQNGNQIRLGFVHDRDLLRGISLRFEIETPEQSEVHARADSGGVTVEGVRGPVDAKTDSGGVHVDNVKGEVHAAADSGGIHLSNIGGAVYARVDSGGVEASDIAGSIDAQTDSGSVRLSQTRAAPIRAKADSGGVSVKLAPGAGYDVSIQTDSGHISVPEMTVHSSFSAHHVEGKIRGGGPSVEIRVNSGSVSVE